MSISLRWLASVSASCLHAAEGLCRGRAPADQRFAAALAEPAGELSAAIKAGGLPAPRFWRELIALSAGIENNRQLAETALAKTVGRGAQAQTAAPRIAAAIAALEAAAQRAAPKLLDELALRGEPIRLQWEARGPGMLHRIGQLTDERLLAPSADVILVQPTFGGGGAAHLDYNSVRLEAVLANPLESLPEVVRLCWLLAQLQLDLPVFSEAILRDRLPHVAALAMLPPVLTAAEHVELIRPGGESIAAALAAWNLPSPADVDMAALLADWWGTYLESRPGWTTALAALDRMLA
jgi:hypothetical protein